MTPRGLKVRLELPWAFGLLARLFEKDRRTDAFRVLKTCEAIESIPAVVSFIAGTTVAWHKDWPVWSICVAQIVGTLIGTLLTQYGLFVLVRPFGILALGSIWSWVSGYGLLLLSALVNSWMARGWVGIIWWLVGTVGAFFLRYVLEFLAVKKRFGLGGSEMAFTSSEVNFFNAYRLHAARLGIALDLEISEEEVESGLWRGCLLHYAMKYPEAVARFPDHAEIFNANGPSDD